MMAHPDLLPTTVHLSNMTPIPIDLSETLQAINLDCSTRAKIVIPTKLPTSKQPIAPTVSIFSRKSRKFDNLDSLSAKPLEPPVQGLRMQVQAPLPQPTNNPLQRSAQPPSSLTSKMLPKSKTIDDSKIKKQRTTSSSHRHLPTSVPVAFPERKIIPVPSRLRISSTSSSATPTPEPEPAKHTSLSILPTSQYAEEYGKCPCTKGRAVGQPPCDRCQLMLLADRFCELIDVQCQKWGIPPKH